MSSKTDARLTPGQRLSRGLRYTAVGPVDVTRGGVGLGWQGAASAAGSIRERVEKSRLAKELAKELEARRRPSRRNSPRLRRSSPTCRRRSPMPANPNAGRGRSSSQRPE